MADVKWIKIVTDIFDDEKILLIEQMPDADTIIVVWFKLLCLAGKQNNSGVFMINERIPYTDEMLSSIFRRPLNTVRLALKMFEEYGMIEIHNGFITIPNWGKHQTLDKIEQKTAYQREYMRKYRQKQLCKANSKSNSKANVSSLDKNKNKNKSIDSMPAAKNDGKPKSVFISLILNDKTYFDVTDDFVKELQPLYPAVDVKDEFLQMAGWLIGNSKNRKTRTGIKRFITGWLSRSQDRARKNGAEQKAEQKKAMDTILNRRMKAEQRYIKVKEKIEADGIYGDLSAKMRGLKFDLAKLESQNKPTGDMAERLTKLEKQLADRLSEMGYTETDLEIKYTCPICQDKGYVKGKKCKCLLALEV